MLAGAWQLRARRPRAKNRTVRSERKPRRRRQRRARTLDDPFQHAERRVEAPVAELGRNGRKGWPLGRLRVPAERAQTLRLCRPDGGQGRAERSFWQRGAPAGAVAEGRRARAGGGWVTKPNRIPNCILILLRSQARSHPSPDPSLAPCPTPSTARRASHLPMSSTGMKRPSYARPRTSSS